MDSMQQAIIACQGNGSLNFGGICFGGKMGSSLYSVE